MSLILELRNYALERYGVHAFHPRIQEEEANGALGADTRVV